jgi:putative ATP-binding cassette transporter
MEEVQQSPSSQPEQLMTPQHYTAWKLIKLYWQSDFKKKAYLSFIVTVIMTVVLVAFDVVFSYWSNYFYNALQDYNMSGAIKLLVFFFVLAGLYIVLAVYRYYISQLFGLGWRKWLTEQLIGRWLERRDYYYLENFDEHTDNPDQRIQEDVGSLVASSISLSIGAISAVTTFVGFIYVLWQLSGDLRIPLGSLGVWHIHGYLVWVAIVYSTIGSYLTYRIGRPLISLTFEQQRREASFRFAAIDLRSHSENVALYHGEKREKNILGRLFGSVLDNWYSIIVRQKILLWFTAGYNQIAVVLPLIVALPNYFGKVFQLGGLMQSLRAFTQIQDALSFIVNSFPQLAEWRAVTQRLTTFLNHMQDIDECVAKQNKLVVTETGDQKIEASNMFVSTPRGEMLLKDINEEFIRGKSYLIKGMSGLGKSTFIRALAGIWPYASGNIVLPQKQKLMYLSQKPYMPIGSLAAAIAFPGEYHSSMDAQLKDVLCRCHLEGFIPRLQETSAWSQQLSPGEQQRIAFARIILQKPDWVFLDESTSMLDVNNEKSMYQLLKDELPNCTIISVGHRPTLDEFHDSVVDLAKYGVEAETSMA